MKIKPAYSFRERQCAGPTKWDHCDHYYEGKWEHAELTPWSGFISNNNWVACPGLDEVTLALMFPDGLPEGAAYVTFPWSGETYVYPKVWFGPTSRFKEAPK